MFTLIVLYCTSLRIGYPELRKGKFVGYHEEIIFAMDFIVAVDPEMSVAKFNRYVMHLKDNIFIKIMNIICALYHLLYY